MVDAIVRVEIDGIEIRPVAPPRTRNEARAVGAKFFYPGPCTHGHDVPKRADNGHCVECHRLRAARYYAAERADPQRHAARKARLKQYRIAEKEHAK